MPQHNDFTPDEIKLIAERVCKHRKAVNLSQRQLADKINAKKDVIYRIEKGDLKSINREHLRQIAYALQCNPAFFLLETDDYRNPYQMLPLHYELPYFQHTVDTYIYKHQGLGADLEYMSQYMHPDMQEQILKTIHTMVLLHQCGVNYPNTSPQQASSISYIELNKKCEENFWKKQENP